MPAFTPNQKRQSSACECFVLLPRGSVILAYKNTFLLMPWSSIERSTRVPQHTCVLITLEQLAEMAGSTSHPHTETKLTWVERRVRP